MRPYHAVGYGGPITNRIGQRDRVYAEARAVLMSGRASSPKRANWTIGGAEELLQSLPGVLSARVVAKPGGEVEEIHLLTTTEVSPKATVRNVESALLAHYDLT